MLVQKQQDFLTNSPFDLRDDRSYAVWREHKLAQYPQSLAEIMVDIENPHALSEAESAAIREACGRANMALYKLKGASTLKGAGTEPDAQAAQSDKSCVADLGRQFGLNRLDSNLYADDDGISALHVSGELRQFDYIPYSNRPMSWHTDGYYNTAEKRIRSMVLHCVSPAAEGGDNSMVDHEMIYLQLRDKNPAYIEALMQPEVMTIPANVENGEKIRAEQTGPVFSVDEETGALHMRYTARTRSIQWQQDKLTQAAVQYLEELLAADSPTIFHHRLEAGQGIICNNVLHQRSAFTDNPPPGQQRLFYRARYYDRIA